MTYSQNSYRGIVTATTVNKIGQTTQTIKVRTTQDGKWRIAQQTGAPDGSLNNEPGTDPNVPGYAAMSGVQYRVDEASDFRITQDTDQFRILEEVLNSSTIGLPYENTVVPKAGE